MKYGIHNMEEKVKTLSVRLCSLEEKNLSLEESITSRSQTLSQLQALDELGISLRDLKLIRFAIREIAVANDLYAEYNSAWKKFLDDVDNQYDRFRGKNNGAADPGSKTHFSKK
jgi:hypothetical protein